MLQVKKENYNQYYNVGDIVEIPAKKAKGEIQDIAIQASLDEFGNRAPLVYLIHIKITERGEYSKKIKEVWVTTQSASNGDMLQSEEIKVI